MLTIHSNFCDLSENIISRVLKEQSAENCLFIFPNENSKRRAHAEFQQKWSFSQTLFLTMEKLKELLFLSPTPVLREEKRTIAFYETLSALHKNFFRIHTYFQSIELAHRFFELWEEFNEELVDEQIALHIISQGSELFDWQKEIYSRLREMKAAYQQFLLAKGFNDHIFLCRLENMNIESLKDWRKVVVVNQYYYTKLEKEIILRLARSGKEVEIYYQQAEPNQDREIFSCPPLSLFEFRDKSHRTNKITIFECKNDFSMITSLWQCIHQHQITQIVDPVFGSRPYSQFLSINKFQINCSISFARSSIYQFFYSTYRLIDSLIYDPQQNNELLPLQSVLDAVVSDSFFNFIIGRMSTSDQKKAQEQTLDFLYWLMENDFQYIDLQKKYLTLFPAQPAQQYLLLIVAFVKNMLTINSLPDLIAKIGEHQALIPLEKIISEQETKYSEIRATFFQALADFSMIDKLGLVSDSSQLFGSDQHKTEGMIKAAGFLRLFIDYLKFKKIRLNYQPAVEDEFRIAINSLEDTRNMTYKKVAVLNVSEDILPPARQAQFLFSEKQRHLLGLKTYDEIRQREKYYFFRMLLNSEEVYLFSLKNIDLNLERSSFVEELSLFLPQHILLKTEPVADRNYRSVYHHFLKKSPYRPDKENSRQMNFYRLPLNREGDFPDQQLAMTPTSLSALLENSFLFYITHHCRLEERIKKIAADFSNKLIGNIVHEVINEIWRQLIEQEHGALFGFNFGLVDEKLIKRVLSAILGKHENYYKIPQNYSQTYFQEIIVPVVEQGTKEFFRLMQERIPSVMKKVEIIPEKEYGQSENIGYKEFITPAENELGLDIRLRGRADLRIVFPEENFYAIFDYKTGGSELNQLLIYELYYYLIDHPEKMDQVHSYFYFVFDSKLEELTNLLKKKSKQEMIKWLKEKIVATVDRIARSGFELPRQKSQLNRLPEISRSDLYLPLMKKFSNY